MIYLFCGVIIGVVMGLTGAGGALVAIPLFMQFLDMSLKEASVYSLLAVVVASMLNYLAQRKNTQYKTALIIIVFSALGSYLTAPYKENLPSLMVAILLTLVSLYALYSIWMPGKKLSNDPTVPRESAALSVTIGLVLGALTTFTGLGGGVLMLPLFLALYRYSQSQAVATSLLAVGLSSLASLLIQVARGIKFELKIDLVYLLVGILFSVLLLGQFAKRLPDTVVTRTRQIVFTLVVVIALLKIF
jgi:uncharacterized protein